jgi:hypothetical protein
MIFTLDTRMRDTINRPHGAEEYDGPRDVPYWRRTYKIEELNSAMIAFIEATATEDEVILKATNYVS